MTPARRPLVLGNWKMNTTVKSATALVRTLLPKLRPIQDRDIALAPPFTGLALVARLLKGSGIRLAAQDLFWEEQGAYTGEISGAMLADVGATLVLIGHSERRIHLGESDAIVSRKTRAALGAGLWPVVCVGESEAARDAGQATAHVRGQLSRSLEGVPAAACGKLAIAYEPIWAIGTGRPATPADAAVMHAAIRQTLASIFPSAKAGAIRVLYGGSVTAANVDALMAHAEVDGVLVGGASLRAAEFARIAAFERRAPRRT